MGKVLFYYFAFPHYRAEILKELKRCAGNDAVFAAGTSGRASIRALTSEDLDFLQELESVHIGPLSWEKGIAREAISSNFQAVVLGPATASVTTWTILLSRRLLRRRTYLWGQCGKPGERRVKRYLRKAMNWLAHGLLVYGEGEAAAAIDLGTSPRRVHIVNNATHHNDQYNTPELSAEIYRRLQLRTKEALLDRHLVLTYVGRLTESKRVSVLLEAARHLRRRYEHLRVQVVGGGSEEGKLKKNFSDSFIDYLGWIYDSAELNEVLQNSTLIVAPFELGLLAIDGLRAGVPVLIPEYPRNGSEVEALTDEVNSVRFASGDSSAIVEAVEQWLRIAPRITESAYTQARESALRTWSPGSVARNILDAIDYMP